MSRKILISYEEVEDIDSELQKANNNVEKKKGPITSFVPNDKPPVDNILGECKCTCSNTTSCGGGGGGGSHMEQ